MKVNRNSLVGAILLLMGLSLVLKILFGIDFPVFRVAIALGIMYMGYRLVRGSAAGGTYSGEGQDAVAFGEAEFEVLEDSVEEHSFSVLCGKGTIDLSASGPALDRDPEIEINVVLGYCIVHYNPARPTRITLSSFLADAQLPDGNSVVLGSITYRTPGLPPDGRCLRLRVNSALSRVSFIPKNPPAPPRQSKG